MSAQTPQPDEGSTARLERLEAYLREDPSNPGLLTEAFGAALQCAQWERAAFHLRHAQALQPGNLAWSLREGDLLLAQGQYQLAAELLGTLMSLDGAPREFTDAVLHNLAWIAFQDGRYQDCADRLTPRLQDLDHPASAALARLWLRALHHAGQLDQAVTWAAAADAKQQLPAAAAGVASLAALDADQLERAGQWAARALEQATPDDRPIEALVTQSSLALARQDAAQARTQARAALQISPRDGRAWSARAMADLLAGDLPTALAHFDNALATMPGHIGTWHGKAWAQLLSSDLQGAQRSFTSALDLDRNFAESHGGLAVALALQGRTEEAQQHIERALRLDAFNLSGRYAQAIVGGEIRDLESFQALAKRLLRGQDALLKAVLRASRAGL
ncbi:tetratricopeptide repeat protein [Delftia sp. RIT313]|uniref:tetratricopeptide repeat protein n=1 Tax=Delftia sp. RIT313 TaxID=1468410 RepID=UPI00044E9209|nr:tetratricopeptide repeat protein [Delftia sp. RIT313]EZP49890.1 putative PEP-CTERM system TPR-repeat lipoprotein [Delftia sp. RIT313]